MSNSDMQKLIDLANHIRRNRSSKEQAMERLVNAGILGKTGNFTKHYPALAAYAKKNKCTTIVRI